MAKEAPTRERMEEAEARSEEKYDRPPEPASDAVLTVTRPAGKIVDANAAAAEMLGYSLPELIGLLVPQQIIAPEVLEQTQREWFSQMRENGHYSVATVWVRKDGSRIPVKASGKAITLEGRPLLHLIARDIREREGADEAPTGERMEEAKGGHQGGPPSAFVVTAVAALVLLAAALALEVVHQYVEWPLGAGDWEIVEVIAIASSMFAFAIFSVGRWRELVREITEREGAEEALRESEERLKLLYESAPDAYYLNDLRGVFVDGNAAAEQITGYKREELIGKNFLTLKLLPPEEVPKAAATLAKNVAGQPTGPDEFTLNRKGGGQVTVEIRTFPVRINNQTLVLGIARDVTDRKRAEEALRKAHDELEMRVQERTADLSSANEQLQQEVTERRRMEEALQAARDELEGKVERQLLRRNPYGLTFRELTVLHLVAAGESDKQIGLKLGISRFTAQKHTSNILAKMGAGSRTEAAARALREGLLD